MQNMTCLNLGSGNRRIPNYLNVDIREDLDVDIVHDLTKFPYPFEDESVDQIIAEELFEHIPYRFERIVFSEIYRILKRGGWMKLTVPNMGEMCRMWYETNHMGIIRICECVKKEKEGRVDPNCKRCRGKAEIHPIRWKRAFSGDQVHEQDIHYNHFFKPLLSVSLQKAGFSVQDNSPNNTYKIKLVAKK